MIPKISNESSNCTTTWRNKYTTCIIRQGLLGGAHANSKSIIYITSTKWFYYITPNSYHRHMFELYLLELCIEGPESVKQNQSYETDFATFHDCLHIPLETFHCYHLTSVYYPVTKTPPHPHHSPLHPW